MRVKTNNKTFFISYHFFFLDLLDNKITRKALKGKLKKCKNSQMLKLSVIHQNQTNWLTSPDLFFFFSLGALTQEIKLF